MKDLEDLLEEYERVWSERVPSLDDLHATFAGFSDEPTNSLEALSELVKVDIHHRWTKSSATSSQLDDAKTHPNVDYQALHVEEYARRFPVLRDSADYPDEFLLEELDARRRVGDVASAASLLSRFSELTAARAENLVRDAAYQLGLDDGITPDRSSPDIRIAVADRFEIKQQLGQGSMGRVYLAFDPRLEREVAIKIPIIPLGDDPIQRERFLREGRAAGSISHPNIVAVHETGQSKEFFIASEYVAGPTLKQWFENRNAIPPAVAARLISLIARGVAVAHAQGIVHRDLKPSNVLLAPIPQDGSSDFFSHSVELNDETFCPKVSDFGLAGFVEAGSGLTMTGTMLGTVAYMSPEQASGAPAGCQSDVFSLGVMLYELLTEVSPFARDTYVGTLDRVRNYDPPPVHTLQSAAPRDLSAICYLALNKDATRRYSSAKELADDLQRYLSGDPVHARTPGTIERVVRWSRRNPAIALLTTLVFAALLWSLWQNQRLGDSLSTSERLRTEATVAKADLGNANVTLQKVNANLVETNANYQQEVYVQDMILAFDAWTTRNVTAIKKLLDKHVPGPDQTDQRGIEWYVLSRLIQVDESIEFVGHTAKIECIRASPDRKTFVSAARDKTLIHWDVSSGKQLWKQRFLLESPRSIVFKRDGESLIAGANLVREIRTSDGKTLSARTTYHHYPVEALALNPAEDLLVSLEVQQELRFTMLGEKKYEFTDAGRPCWRARRIDFSPDGRFLYFCRYRNDAEDTEFVMWDVEKNKSTTVLSGNKRLFLNCVDAAEDGRIVAVGSTKDIQFFDVESREWIARSRRMSAATLDVEFSPDRRHLACALDEGTLSIIDVANLGRLSGEQQIVHSSQPANDDLNTVVWLDNERLLSGDDSGIVRLHRMPQLMQTQSSFPNRKSHFLLNGELMLVGSESGDPQLVDCTSLQTLATVQGFGDQEVDFAAIDPDQQWLALVHGNQAWIWDLQRQEMVGSFVHELLTVQTEIGSWRIKGISISQHGLVATTGSGGSDRTLQIRNVETLERTAAISADEQIGQVHFAPNGKQLFFGSAGYGSSSGIDRIVEISNLQQTELSIKGDGATWLSDTDLLIDEGKRFHLLDVGQNRITQTFENGDDSHNPSHFVFAPEPRTIITSVSDLDPSSDGLRFWHRGTGRHLGNLSIIPHANAVTPDGKGLRLLMQNETTNRMEFRVLHPDDGN